MGGDALPDLKFQGLLVPEGKGRGMHYRLANPQHLTGNPQLLPESPQHPAGLQGDREEGPISWEALEQVAGAARKRTCLVATRLPLLILGGSRAVADVAPHMTSGTSACFSGRRDS